MNRLPRELLAGYVDGELTDEERRRVEAELEQSSELRAELEEFRKLREVTSMAMYADLPDEVWERYWQSMYRKLERGIGWILFSIGTILLTCTGLYYLLRDLLLSPDIPLVVKIGTGTLVAGTVVLLVSYIRQRLFAYKRDRYREVMR